MEGIESEVRELLEMDHEVLRESFFDRRRSAAAYWDIVKTLLDEVIYFEGESVRCRDLSTASSTTAMEFLHKSGKPLSGQAHPYISYLHVPQSGKTPL